MRMRMCMRNKVYTRAPPATAQHDGALPHKWKNHLYEMNGDVGMSLHEKEREQEDAYTKTESY